MKILSGGQTGADRAALDFAIERGIDTGGWIPRGRRAEDGVIPTKYSTLRETSTFQYPERTRKNILDSDGTLILSHGELTGGSLLTQELANRANRHSIHIDFLSTSFEKAAAALTAWIDKNNIKVLNVAGARASGDPEIYEATCRLLTLVFD